MALAAERAPGGVKPDSLTGKRDAKKNYAQDLSRHIAAMLARCLDREFPKARVLPRSDGSGQEATIGRISDKKRTDVSVWDDAAGLILALSVKTYLFRDFHAKSKGQPDRVGRYQRNVKRNDLELRDEADVLHRRQPYAVVVGLFFTSFGACSDGASGNSSFAHMVLTFRKRVGRAVVVEHDRPDRMEKIYIGLVREGSGEVAFFDVENPPPKNQPPPAESTLSLSELIKTFSELVERRNRGGLTEAEVYAPADPNWEPPDLPDGFEGGAPLSLEDAVESASLAEVLDEAIEER